MRFTEEEAKAAGFVKDKKGNWHDRKVNLPSRHPGEVSKLESDTRHAPQSSHGVQTANEDRGFQRYRIIVTATFRRHVDPDNLAPKVWIDQLKEFGIIPDDSSLFVREFVKRVVKVEKWEPETTTIEVYEY